MTIMDNPHAKASEEPAATEPPEEQVADRPQGDVAPHADVSDVPRSGVNADDFDALLTEVDSHFNRARFGQYSGYKPPFTRQYKAEIKRLFPKDGPVFDHLNVNEAATIRRAIAMRSITLVTFFYFAFGFINVISQYRGGKFEMTFGAIASSPVLYFRNIEAGSVQGAVVALLMYFAIAFAVRTLTRYILVDKIGQGATRAANVTFRYLSAINNSLDKAIDNSSVDEMYRSQWPQRSSDWIKIAQWHAKRYEYIDRYVTAVAWRIEDRFSWIEVLALGVKYGVLVFLALSVFNLTGADWLPDAGAPPGGGDAALTAIFAGLVFVCWGLALPLLWLWSSLLPDFISGAASNNLWVKKFLESVEGFDSARDHIIQKIASVVSADKTTIMNMRPGQGGS
ncbi:hypothetical protein [Hyphococcus sp.]|uniref:hypothetical protein n=1 Tax=Hyphococcus sp. TaxID=2038636 RepID=UPI0035C671BF